MSLPGLSTNIVVCFSYDFVALNIPQNNLIVTHQFQYCDCIDIGIDVYLQTVGRVSASR